ncbi:hypothetical protein ACFX11_024125 [Malus domestica]
MMLQFTSLVVGLLFGMHALGQFSTAHAHQGKEDISMTGKRAVLPDQKEPNVDGISIAGSRMIGLGGRKMVAHRVLRKSEPVRPDGQQNEEASTTSKNPGANRSTSDGNCNFEGREDLNVKCKLGDRDKSNTSTASSKKYSKVSHHDFVAFGKDNPKASSNFSGKRQNQMNQQDDVKILELTTLKSTSAGSLEIPRDLIPNHSEDFKTKHPTTEAQMTKSYDEKDDHKLTDNEARSLLKATREIANLMRKDYHHQMGRRKPPVHNLQPRP